jgi:GT2 family glycosyltransferase
MNVSVIIPTLNRWDLLAGAITAVKATAPDAEIVVVDEGLPFADHCNLGAERATGDVFVFLNDDAIVHDGWGSMFGGFADPHVGIVGARLLYPNGTIQHAGVYLDRPGGCLTAHNVLTDEPSRQVEAVTGACLAIRAATFADLGGFDAGFVNGYEDVDLCLEAAAQNWTVWYERSAVVTHHESQSGPARWTHVGHNVARLNEKWPGVAT